MESRDRVTILTPFLRTISGRVARIKTAFVRTDLRKRWPARRLMISRARLERIPLHSLLTSMVTPGNKKMNPVLRTGTPSSWNAASVTSAEPVCNEEIA